MQPKREASRTVCYLLGGWDGTVLAYSMRNRAGYLWYGRVRVQQTATGGSPVQALCPFQVTMQAARTPAYGRDACTQRHGSMPHSVQPEPITTGE
jgi:hypothetical protein